MTKTNEKTNELNIKALASAQRMIDKMSHADLDQLVHMISRRRLKVDGEPK